MHEIGLTDYYFKELLSKNKEYRAVLVNGICGLNISPDELIELNSEERDSVTYKTIQFDIKLVANNIKFDIEAQKNIVDSSLNKYGEYEYDINRAIYYLTVLHSGQYRYREKGYDSRQSIVVFLYNYDIPGDDYIQKIKLCNQKYNREYDNIQIYRVSLAKIPENSKIELERALKLLSELDLDQYLEDDSAIVKEAADMLSTYDKSERAAELREARAKAELDKNSELEVARKQGKAIGLEQGKEESKAQTISHMKAQGLDAKTISKLTGYSLESVVKVFESKWWWLYGWKRKTSRAKRSKSQSGIR